MLGFINLRLILMDRNLKSSQETFQKENHEDTTLNCFMHYCMDAFP